MNGLRRPPLESPPYVPPPPLRRSPHIERGAQSCTVKTSPLVPGVIGRARPIGFTLAPLEPADVGECAWTDPELHP